MIEDWRLGFEESTRPYKRFYLTPSQWRNHTNEISLVSLHWWLPLGTSHMEKNNFTPFYLIFFYISSHQILENLLSLNQNNPIHQPFLVLHNLHVNGELYILAIPQDLFSNGAKNFEGYVKLNYPDKFALD